MNALEITEAVRAAAGSVRQRSRRERLAGNRRFRGEQKKVRQIYVLCRPSLTGRPFLFSGVGPAYGFST